MLLGIKSRIEPFRAWLLSWGSNSPPDTNPCALCGPNGVGKTQSILTLTAGWGFDPEFYRGDGLTSFLNMVRLPTMEGRRRLAVIDDAHLLSSKEWKVVESEAKARQIPIVLTVEDQSQIPWAVRRGTLRTELSRPSPSALRKFLTQIRDDRDLPHTDSEIRDMANEIQSFRQAELTILTTPPGMEVRLESVDDPTGVSPMARLASVEFNNADPEIVGTGIVLHSHGWEIPGMTSLVEDYLKSIHTQSQDRVPYRNRPIRGSNRRI